MPCLSESALRKNSMCRKVLRLPLMGCCAFLLSATGSCGNGDEAYLPPSGPGPFQVEVQTEPIQGPLVTVTHAANPGKVVWASVPGKGFAAAAAAEAKVTENRGSFLVEDKILRRCESQTVDHVLTENGTVTLSGRLAGDDCDVGYSMQFTPLSQNQLGFHLQLVDATPEYNRIFLRYASSPDERFFGFGEQFTYLDQKGRSLPILAQEQGIGRGMQPLTWLLDLVSPGSAGSWFSTYTAVPQYITNFGRSLFLENEEVSVFDMQAADEVEIKLFGPSMQGRILRGDSPLDLIREFTSYAGRMPPLPDWMNSGAVVGMQGGTAEVFAKLDMLEAVDTPVGAFWLQDWVGKRTTIFGSQLWWNWVLDTQQYPGWAQMVQTLSAKGIRVMIYINPYLVDIEGQDRPGPNLFAEARDLGYLVKNQAGEPYQITNTSFTAGIVDLTNPDARTWYKGIIKERMLGIGAAGWMADYGEGLPFDSVLFSGEDPAAFHNRYPESWAELNREVLAEEGLVGDVVFFCRSGATRSPGAATLFWCGDQLVTWDGDDGMKSAVKGMLSSGFSGYSLNHSDIGGFTTFAPLFTRSEELLMRWMELSAFTSVYRTHEGNQPGNNTQFYTNQRTLEHFARFAKVFRALAFYRSGLMQEAHTMGYPLVRHPLLHYPDDPNVWALNYQWMLGSEFMVVPVVDEGADKVNVYLPAGQWVYVWSEDEDEVYGSPSQGVWLNGFPAPMGKPAVFYRLGSEAGKRFVQNLCNEGLK